MATDADEETGDARSGTTLIYVSGVAAVLLVAILVYAVIDTANSSHRHAPAPVTTSARTTPTSAPRSTTTSVRTSSPVSTTDLSPTSDASPSPTESAAELAPPPESSMPESSTGAPETTATISNPYATTSSPNAGAY